MAFPSVTNTFTNGTSADATQVNTNFTDLINGLSDGTKDLSISALTCAGTTTLNGNVNLGNASGDDITFTGSLASSIPIKTKNAFDIGSATLGLKAVFFGNGTNTNTANIIGGVTTSSYTLTLPVAVPSGNNASLITSTSGALSYFVPVLVKATEITSQSAGNAIQWTNEIWDTASAWDGTTFTAPYAGYYLCTLAVVWTGGGLYISAYINGAEDCRLTTTNVAGDGSGTGGSAVVSLAANDALTFRPNATLTGVANAATYTYCTITRVG